MKEGVLRIFDRLVGYLGGRGGKARPHVKPMRGLVGPHAHSIAREIRDEVVSLFSIFKQTPYLKHFTIWWNIKLLYLKIPLL